MKNMISKIIDKKKKCPVIYGIYHRSVKFPSIIYNTLHFQFNDYCENSHMLMIVYRIYYTLNITDKCILCNVITCLTLLSLVLTCHNATLLRM